MKTIPSEPLSVVQDPKIRSVLERLHRQARREIPGLLLHYLPLLPRVLRGKPLPWEEMEPFFL